jgi:Domain of unknown function DUF29
MSKIATKPPANDLYEADFYAWTQEQARLLRERRWADLDLDNLVDEVESVGRSDKRQIESRLEVLLAHLLKWKFQPGGRGSSWIGTIFEQRSRIAGLVEESPSLREFQRQEVFKSYHAARLSAAKETGIALGVFPEECPFTSEQVLDLGYFPENPEAE